MKDFYMVLPSNGCPMTQPDNQACSYITDWESEIFFPGKWRVALTEFSFNAFHSFMKGCNLTYWHYSPWKYNIEFLFDNGEVSINGRKWVIESSMVKDLC